MNFHVQKFLYLVQFSHLVMSDSSWPMDYSTPGFPVHHQLPVQFSSVAQSCPTLYDPMDCSMPGLPVHHQLQEFIQIHVHWVGDAIQQSHPLSSPSPPAYSLSLQSGSLPRSQFFTSIGWSIGVSASASIVRMNIQFWLPLEWTGWISWKSKGLLRAFSNTSVQKHQFFGTQFL